MPKLNSTHAAAKNSIGSARRWRSALCLIASSAVIGVAQANPMIGSSTLLGWLKSQDERDKALGVGFIGGVREATYQKEHCASADVKVSEVLGAVRRTLDGMPQYGNMPASWSVVAALQARWPCPINDLKQKSK